MFNLFKLKSVIPIILSITIMFMAIPLSASDTINTTQHKEFITQYIEDIRIIQDRVFYLFQIALSNLPQQDTIKLLNDINLVNNRIEELNKSISSYLGATPSLSYQNRDILLAFNALSFVKNSLYQLTLLINATNNIDKSLLLEDFYMFRRTAIDALNRLENLILEN